MPGRTGAPTGGSLDGLLAPGLHMLLLGATALSKYALAGLLATVDQRYLTTDIVQFIGDAGKAFPAALQTTLLAVHPSLVIVSPAALSPKLRKAGATSVLTSLQSISGAWQVVQTAQTGTIEISSNERGWTMRSDA